MDNDKFEGKLDKMHDDIVEIKVIMARNTGSLEQHMERTAIAEENITLLRADVEPIKVHVAKVQGGMAFAMLVAKIVAGIATVVGVLVSVYQFIHH